MIVAIDPGHGGPKSRGCAYPPDKPELIEAEYVLSFAWKLAQALEDAGHSWAMTRGADAGTSFTERARAAKDCDADIAISLHVNANLSPAPRGLQTYHMPDDELARRLAHCIQSKCPPALKSKWARVIAASLDGFGDDAVLRRYTMPAVLVELGFASNDADRQYLLSDAGRAELVIMIVEGLNQYAAELAAA